MKLTCFIDAIWFDTILDAILTCAEKPTRVSIIYRTDIVAEHRLVYISLAKVDLVLVLHPQFSCCPRTATAVLDEMTNCWKCSRARLKLWLCLHDEVSLSATSGGDWRYNDHADRWVWPSATGRGMFACLLVCLSVRKHISGTTRPIYQMHMADARSIGSPL